MKIRKIRKLIFVLLATILYTVILYAPASAERVEFGVNADDLALSVEESNDFRTVVRFEISAFDREAVDINGKTYYSISCPGGNVMLNAGEPALPRISRSIIIPDDTRVEIKVLSANYMDFPTTPVIPSKGNLLRLVNPEDVPYTFGPVYNTAKWYPAVLASARDPYILRDFRGVVIDLNAFQYNPANETLRVYTSVTVAVVNAGQGLKNVLYRSEPTIHLVPDFDLIYKRQFINYGSARERYTPVEETGDMLIITYDGFEADMEPFVEWKKQKGIETTIVNVSSIGNNSTAIYDYVKTFYDSSDLTWLLLVGDADQVSSPFASGGESDPSYAKLEGHDDYPDIFVGRFSAENSSHVQTQVERNITYEKNPHGTGWFNRGTGIASNEGPGHYGEYDYQHIDYIRDDLLAYGYTVVDQIYDPGASATQVTNALNQGRSIINYCGHGSTTSWSTTGFSNSHVNALVNDNMLPFIISVACVNGNFGGTTCFGEAWLRATHNGAPTGAIATYMSSINQSWNPPMDAQDEVNDLLVAEAKTTFGGLCFNGSCRMIEINGTAGVEMYNTWHIFGDPSLDVRTDEPQTITASYPAAIMIGQTMFSISNASCLDGTATLFFDDEIIAHGQLVNGAVTLSLDPAPASVGTAVLTVTAHNYRPYQADIEIIPSGPAILPIAPAGGDLFDVGENIEIIWVTSDPAAAANVKIEFSSDGGTNFSTIESSIPNIDYYDWQGTAVESDQCVIRISDADDGDPAGTTGIFSIHDLSYIAGTVTEPNGRISADVYYTGPMSGSVTTQPDGQYIIERLLPGTYELYAESGGDTSEPQQVTLPPDADDVDFEIIESWPIILLAPADGAVLPPVPAATFEWAAGAEYRFKIEFSTAETFPHDHSTLSVPRRSWMPGTTTDDLRVRDWEAAWRIVRSMDQDNGIVYWRVIGKTGPSEPIDISQVRNFTIE